MIQYPPPCNYLCHVYWMLGQTLDGSMKVYDVVSDLGIISDSNPDHIYCDFEIEWGEESLFHWKHMCYMIKFKNHQVE